MLLRKLQGSRDQIAFVWTELETWLTQLCAEWSYGIHVSSSSICIHIFQVYNKPFQRLEWVSTGSWYYLPRKGKGRIELWAVIFIPLDLSHNSIAEAEINCKCSFESLKYCIFIPLIKNFLERLLDFSLLLGEIIEVQQNSSFEIFFKPWNSTATIALPSWLAQFFNVFCRCLGQTHSNPMPTILLNLWVNGKFRTFKLQ